MFNAIKNKCYHIFLSGSFFVYDYVNTSHCTTRNDLFENMGNKASKKKKEKEKKKEEIVIVRPKQIDFETYQKTLIFGFNWNLRSSNYKTRSTQSSIVAR